MATLIIKNIKQSKAKQNLRHTLISASSNTSKSMTSNLASHLYSARSLGLFLTLVTQLQQHLCLRPFGREGDLPAFHLTCTPFRESKALILQSCWTTNRWAIPEGKGSRLRTRTLHYRVLTTLDRTGCAAGRRQSQEPRSATRAQQGPARRARHKAALSEPARRKLNSASWTDMTQKQILSLECCLIPNAEQLRCARKAVSFGPGGSAPSGLRAPQCAPQTPPSPILTFLISSSLVVNRGESSTVIPSAMSMTLSRRSRL